MRPIARISLLGQPSLQPSHFVYGSWKLLWNILLLTIKQIDQACTTYYRRCLKEIHVAKSHRRSAETRSCSYRYCGSQSGIGSAAQSGSLIGCAVAAPSRASGAARLRTPTVPLRYMSRKMLENIASSQHYLLFKNDVNDKMNYSLFKNDVSNCGHQFRVRTSDVPAPCSSTNIQRRGWFLCSFSRSSLPSTMSIRQHLQAQHAVQETVYGTDHEVKNPAAEVTRMEGYQYDY